MIVVTGATGQLGAAFRRLLDDDTRFLPRRELDISDPDAITGVLKGLQPSILINCAAYTAVDRAETEGDTAEAVNATAVGVMAEMMADLGGRFITFSTDYVFDGTARQPYVESDPTRPLNTYGATKRAGEVAALDAHAGALIIRTSWLLSGTHPNFATTMIRLAREGDVAVVDDQRGHPTLVDDLARATIDAVETGATGIIHLTNRGIASRFSLAQEVVDLAGLDRDRIHPCATSDYQTVAERPANSVIDSERLSECGLDPLPPYGPGLRRIVGEILARGT